MTYQSPLTRSRIAQGAAALVDRNTEEKDVAIIDVLTNLRHYCDHHHFDFAKLDRLAYQHYVAEKWQSPRQR